MKAFRVLGRFSFEFQSVARRSFAVLSSIGRLAYIVDGIGTPGIRKGSRRMEGFSVGVVAMLWFHFQQLRANIVGEHQVSLSPNNCGTRSIPFDIEFAYRCFKLVDLDMEKVAEIELAKSITRRLPKCERGTITRGC